MKQSSPKKTAALRAACMLGGAATSACDWSVGDQGAGNQGANNQSLRPWQTGSVAIVHEHAWRSGA